MEQPFVSDDNYSSLIQILTWFLLVVSILSVIARNAKKALSVRQINIDDHLIAIALVFFDMPYTSAYETNIMQLASIGQSVAVSEQTVNGYGKPIATIALQHLNKELKVNRPQYYALQSKLTFSRRNMPRIYSTSLAYASQNSPFWPCCIQSPLPSMRNELYMGLEL